MTTQQKTTIGLITLDSYYKSMEKLLTTAQRGILEKYQKILPGQNSPSLEELNPFFAIDFPRYLRYSFIALLVSFLETQLQEICIEKGNQKGLTEDEVKRELSGEGKVKKAKKFLKEQLVDQFSDSPGKSPRKTFLQQWDPKWEPTLFLVRVRNCILHAGGEISKLKRQSDRESLEVGKCPWKGYSIENDQIMLGDEFCVAAYGEIKTRFNSLFTIV